MGKNNRARRAAKAKNRRSTRHGSAGGQAPGVGRDPFGFSERERAAALFEGAAALLYDNEQARFAAAVRMMSEIDERVADQEIERGLHHAIAGLWDRGWQPVEVTRHVRRSISAAVCRLAESAVLADHAGRAPDTLDPQWAAQVTALGTHGNDGWFSAWYQREAAPLEAIRNAVALLLALRSMGPIAELLAPPGRRQPSPTQAAVNQRPDDPMLAKVRALLAQAESTSFPAEAETFTAKAQELMTRYAIDQVLLAPGDQGDGPITRRVPIDDPYVDPKSLLLQTVAEHSRCRAIFHAPYAMSSVVGHRSDVDAVELLFTSLLVQAQVAMAAEAKTAEAGSRVRSRSFRSSFLVGYACRIGERLAEINRNVEATVEAETGRSVLPVLSARRAGVDDTVDELFGTLISSPVKAGWDGMGSMLGKAAADRAQLSFADLDHDAPVLTSAGARP